MKDRHGAFWAISELCAAGELRVPFGNLNDKCQVLSSVLDSTHKLLQKHPEMAPTLSDLSISLVEAVIFSESLKLNQSPSKNSEYRNVLVELSAVLLRSVAHNCAEVRDLTRSKLSLETLRELGAFVNKLEKVTSKTAYDTFQGRCRESLYHVRDSYLGIVEIIERVLQEDANGEAEGQRNLKNFYGSPVIQIATEFGLSERNLSRWCEARRLEIRSNAALGQQSEVGKSLRILAGLLPNRYQGLNPINQAEVLINLGQALRESITLSPPEFEDIVAIHLKAATELCNKSVDTLNSLEPKDQAIYCQRLAEISSGLSTLSIPYSTSARGDLVIPTLLLAARFINVIDSESSASNRSPISNEFLSGACRLLYSATRAAVGALSKSGKYEVAVNLFDALSVKIPDPLPTCAPLVSTHFETIQNFVGWGCHSGDFERALRASEKIRTLVTDSTISSEARISYWESRIEIGKALSLSDIKTEAIDELKAVVNSKQPLEPTKLAAALRDLAYDALDKDDLGEVTKLLKRLLKLKSDEPEVTLMKASILQRLGADHLASPMLDSLKLGEAKQHLDAALSLGKASAYRKAGDYAQAEEAYKVAIAGLEKELNGSFPVQAKVLRAYSQFLSELGREAEAKALQHRADVIDFVVEFRKKGSE